MTSAAVARRTATGASEARGRRSRTLDAAAGSAVPRDGALARWRRQCASPRTGGAVEDRVEQERLHATGRSELARTRRDEGRVTAAARSSPRPSSDWRCSRAPRARDRPPQTPRSSDRDRRRAPGVRAPAADRRWRPRPDRASAATRLSRAAARQSRADAGRGRRARSAPVPCPCPRSPGSPRAGRGRRRVGDVLEHALSGRAIRFRAGRRARGTRAPRPGCRADTAATARACASASPSCVISHERDRRRQRRKANGRDTASARSAAGRAARSPARGTSPGGGSSSVLSSAFCASLAQASASSKMTTRRRASNGLKPTCRSTSRTTSILMVPVSSGAIDLNVRMNATRDPAAGGAVAAGVDRERGAATSAPPAGRERQAVERLRERDRGLTLADAVGAPEDQAGRKRAAIDRARDEHERRAMAEDVSKRHGRGRHRAPELARSARS